MIQTALNLAYGTSPFNSVVCLGWHKEDTDGIYTIGYIPSDKIDINKITITPKHDYYITANTLTKRERKAENLFSLRNIVIDIDCHSADLTEYDRSELLDEFMFRMERDCDIPTPNIIHYTGRGLQLWWCLNEVAGSLLFLYKTAIQRLIDRLNALKQEYSDFDILEIDGASKNSVGFFRLFGSYNTKTGKLTTFDIKSPDRYDLNELLANIEVLEDEPTETAQQVKHFKAGEYLALNHKRADFIKWLIKSRNAPQGAENRDKLLFLHYNASVQFMSQEMAQASTEQVNKMFRQPLEDLKYIFDYIDNKGFLRFRVQTWFDFLDLTDQERSKYTMQQAGSNYSRDTKRKLTKDDRNKQILKLKEEGKTNLEIAETLQISVRTVYNILKQQGYTDNRKEQIEEYRRKGLKVAEICKILGISKQTYYDILKR